MADSGGKHILTINAGSSSIKLAVFGNEENPKPLFEAAIEGIGLSQTCLSLKGQAPQPVVAPDHQAAAKVLVALINQRIGDLKPTAVGHRIVHGGPSYYRSTLINDQVLTDLAELVVFDPEHLPIEIELIKMFRQLFEQAIQVACFDTAFGHDLPTVARLLAIPRRYETKGIRRYGFHGLSYSYLIQELERLDERLANGRLVLAHLGSGASLVAVSDGKPIDTTMGLTPASGVPMSTRSGDLDPGLELYLAKTEHLNAEQFNHMVNFESGLLGISELSGDMKQLLERETTDPKAKDAVDLFCYQVKKAVGALAAALGGIDGIVFTAGMGEAAPRIRARVLADMEFFGIILDRRRNDASEPVISADGSKVAVRVVYANEAAIIAAGAKRLLDGSARDEA